MLMDYSLMVIQIIMQSIILFTKGNVKMARPFESEYVSLDADGNNFVDVKDYLYSKRYYTSSTPYHMYGFNALNQSKIGMVDW